MGQYNGAVITTAGQAVLAQAIGGAELTITKVVTSATAIPPGTDLTALTTIADVEQTEQPTSVQVFNDNIVQISTRFSNAGVAAAYLIQTLGVFGQVTGGAETLLAVSTAVTPDQMPAEDSIAPSAFIYNIQLTVQSADQITVTVNDAGTATVEDVQALDEAKLDKDGDGKDVTVTFNDSTPDPGVTSLATMISSLVSGISLSKLLEVIKTGLSYIAPKNHAANDVTYGGGNTTNYGHVRLSDVYNSQIGTAEQSIGASQKAVHDAYDTLNSNISNVLSQIAEVKGNYKATTTNWEYTGVSFTLPTLGYYALFASCYEGAAGLALSSSNSLNSIFTKIESIPGISSSVWRTPVGIVAGATVYLYVKKRSVPSTATEYVIGGYAINKAP